MNTLEIARTLGYDSVEALHKSMPLPGEDGYVSDDDSDSPSDFVPMTEKECVEFAHAVNEVINANEAPDDDLERAFDAKLKKDAQGGSASPALRPPVAAAPLLRAWNLEHQVGVMAEITQDASKWGPEGAGKVADMWIELLFNEDVSGAMRQRVFKQLREQHDDVFLFILRRQHEMVAVALREAERQA